MISYRSHSVARVALLALFVVYFVAVKAWARITGESNGLQELY